MVLLSKDEAQERNSLTRYRHLSVKKVSLTDLILSKTPKAETSRQRTARERDEEITSVLNEAATLPASEAVAIYLKEGQKLPTLRLAVQKALDREKRQLNFAVRGQTIYISKGDIPGGRGRKRRQSPAALQGESSET